LLAFAISAFSRFQQSLEFYTEIFVPVNKLDFFFSSPPEPGESLGPCSEAIDYSTLDSGDLDGFKCLRLLRGTQSATTAPTTSSPLRSRSPVPVPSGGTPGSPTPAGGRLLGANHVSTFGALLAVTMGVAEEVRLLHRVVADVGAPLQRRAERVDHSPSHLLSDDSGLTTVLQSMAHTTR